MPSVHRIARTGASDGCETDLETTHRASRVEREGPQGVAADGLCFSEAAQSALTDASHVKTALTRFDQVEDVSDADRDMAFANIKLAAKHYGIHVAEQSWHDLGKRPRTPSPAHEQ